MRLGVLAMALAVVAPEQQPAVACASLSQLLISDVAITDATPIADRGGNVAHCRVSGRIGKEINFTVQMPERWNGRFFGGGAGGFAGRVENQAAASLNRGFATAGTDTGHQADGLDASWALNNIERQINFGHLAIHRTAETAKAIIKAYYGQAPRYSYFYGCSNGGRQALMEAQRYPGDYDGIIACAPAFDFANIQAWFMRNAEFASVLTMDALGYLESKVLEACDAGDGLRDGLLSDPPACRFDVRSLAVCPAGAASANCVTGAQRAAIAAIYAPVKQQDMVIYPGQPFGTERGWYGWMTNAGNSPGMQSTFATQIAKNFDPATIARHLNADSSDLSAFKARGGKLIMAHGWADPAINAVRSIEYYDTLKSADPRVSEFVRLFLQPGVLHGPGGPGPDTADWFTAIVDWVEHGRAPDRVLAWRVGEDGNAVLSRPLCPHPQRAIYRGTGRISEAASFTCGQ